jgi:GH35 family endo-1,4-beta-xylanase
MIKYLILITYIFFTSATLAQTPVYDQLWNDPLVTERINNGIEKYRKGDATIVVLDKSGKPVESATIEVRQKTHEFLFGCNLFVLGQLAAPELNQKYETAFTNLFNFATLPFYWKELEPEQGKPRFSESSEKMWRRPPPDLLVKWCKDHNITAKGHCLMYVKDIFMPSWTEKNNPELLLKQGQKHMTEIAARYRDDIPIWDVANEEIQRVRTLPDQWYKVPNDYLAWCFKEAGSLFPKSSVLLYNDGTIVNENEGSDWHRAIIQGLIEKKVRLDAMGIQFHGYKREEMLDGKIFPPEQLIKVYDKYGQLGLPMYVTEITIPGRDKDGFVLQAKILEKMYRLWFSTPNMAGITYWNLGDGTAFEKENEVLGGLLDIEMNPKPAYQVLDKLINHEWKTTESLKTEKNGKATFRGFYGKYQVVVRSNGKLLEQEIILSKSSINNYFIQLSN